VTRYEREYVVLLDDGADTNIWADSVQDAMDTACERGLKPCHAMTVEDYEDGNWWKQEDADTEFQEELFA